MTATFNGTTKDRILRLAKSAGSVTVPKASSLLKLSRRSIKRNIDALIAEGRLQKAEGTKSPAIYTLTVIKRKKIRKPAPEKTPEKAPTLTNPSGKTPTPLIRGGHPDEHVEQPGYVCHPMVDPHSLPRTFVRPHVNGVFNIPVEKEGKMPETFEDPDGHFYGGWSMVELNKTGNAKFSGFVKFDYDKKKFTIQTISKKDGSIPSLNFHIHPRYIYWKDEQEVAMAEFLQQVKDVTDVLECHGWKFGQPTLRGQFHTAFNDRMLGKLMSTINYQESETDLIHYDNSHGIPEAEVYHDHPMSEEDVEVMVYLPRIVREQVELTKLMQARLSVVETNQVELVKMNIAMGQAVQRLTDLTEGMLQNINAFTQQLQNAVPTTTTMTTEQPIVTMDEETRRYIYG